MSGGSGENLVNDTQWAKDKCPHIFRKYIKDRKQDQMDLEADIELVFKDLSIEFEFEEYEDLLKEAKQNIPQESIVTKKQFEVFLTEWIMLFKEEVTSTLLTECLDIIQEHYNENSKKIEDVIKYLSGGLNTSMDVSKFPDFVKGLLPILEVRIVNLNTKKPKSDENV